jgi:plasmid stability protein
MAVLNIRNLPNEIHARLRVRAAKAGRSMEAEVRAILIEVCQKEETQFSVTALQNWVDRFYGDRKPHHVVDEFIRERRAEAAQE